MNRHLIIQIVFFMLAGAANAADQAHNQSAVSLTDVGSFSDFASADYGPQQGRAELQRSLQNSTGDLAAKYLPPQHNLYIEFIDIDMAGELIPAIRPPICRDAVYPSTTPMPGSVPLIVISRPCCSSTTA